MAAIETTTFRGRKALRLRGEGREAIVVPSLSGRVMHFGAAGGPNLLWNCAPGRTFAPDEWKNWGGDKAWPAPQAEWGLYQSAGSWPPHPSWDGLPWTERIEGETLVLTSPLLHGFGVRATRRLRFVGETLSLQTVFTRQAGTSPAAVQTAVWHVTQLPPPDALFLALNPESTYARGFHWFGGNPPAQARVKTLDGAPRLLRLTPTDGGYKLGADLIVPGVAAAVGGQALVIKATRQGGDYPEGASGSGFPITLYNGGDADPSRAYVEVEAMSPLALLRAGQSVRLDVSWRLAPLPSANLDAPETLAALRALLR